MREPECNACAKIIFDGAADFHYALRRTTMPRMRVRY